MPPDPKKSDESRPTRPSRKMLSAIGLLLTFIIVCVGYANSFSVPFHFDDDVHIKENHYVHLTDLSWERIKQAAVQDRKQNRPFSNLSFALNFYFFGESPFSYHLFNLLIHLLATAGVFFLVERTLRLGGYPGDIAPVASTIIATAWAIHPVHTQAVTYIVQRQTLMASAFMLGSLIAYITARAAAAGRKKYLAYCLCALSFFIAAGSKETALMTPVLILLYELFIFQKLSFSFTRQWKSSRLAPAAIFIMLVIFGILVALMLRPEMLQKIKTDYENFPFTMRERLLTEPRVVIYYIGLVLMPLPARLSLEHDFNLSTSFIHPFSTIPAMLLILGALVWCFMRVPPFQKTRTWPLISLSVMWYFCNLFIESSFLPLDLVNEHRLYLASLGIIGPVFAGLLVLPLSYRARLVIPGILIALLLAFTVMRNRVWSSPNSLWQDSAKKAPLNSRPWNNLCAVNIQQDNYSQAITCCNKALSLNPDIADAYNNLGIAYSNLGQLLEAQEAFEKALEIDPVYANAHFNFAEFLRRVKGNIPEAVSEYLETLKLDPYDIHAHLNLGHIYYNEGELQKAISHYKMIVKYSPKSVTGYYYLARALYGDKQYEPCAEVALKGLNIDPSVKDLWLLRGSSLMKLGKFKEAALAYADLLDRDKGNPDALIDLGQIYLQAGLVEEAEDMLYRVRFLHSGHPRIPELERRIEDQKEKLKEQDAE